MGEWKEYKLGDVINLKRGYDLPSQNRKIGSIPIFSSSGIKDYHIEPMAKGPGVITGRYGTVGQVFYSEGDYWPLNTTLYVKDFKGNNPKFIYYFLKAFDFEKYSDKSAVPGINRNDVHTEEVCIPRIDEQKSIASILSSFDDKIDLLHRQNKTLEALAETLFRQWFVEEAAERWETGKLGDVISIYDSNRIPVSSMEREKMKIGELYPYYGAATIMDYINEYIFDGEYILMGEDGTVQTDDGYPVLQMATGKFWVNNHAHVFQAMQPYSNFLIYIFLKQTNISNIVTGAVQPKINQENLKSIEFPSPPDKKVKEFVFLINSYWEKIKKNNDQICTLTRLRDTLLPKLMSGEVRVMDSGG